MTTEPFDSPDTDDEPTDPGTPVGRFIPLTPTRSYLGGGILLGQFILGRPTGATAME
ncbi:hypothetical protein ACFQZZ_30830 [Nocardia sp. GCM10030253]|uniref:hypothetical protein n=1 Tax=Nocardia sp. GCM10030253 TaxID=3273404 RepID=UPI0036308D8F